MQSSTQTGGSGASGVVDAAVYIRHQNLTECARRACEEVVSLASVGETLSCERLGEIVASMSCEPREFAPFVQFDPDKYCRSVLAESGRAQLVLIGWAPGQFSPAHDHGGDVENGCAVRVLSGCGVERRYELVDGELALTREVRIAPGDMVLNRGPDIHELGCEEGCTEPLVTLHLYTPPLFREDLHYFDPKQG